MSGLLGLSMPPLSRAFLTLRAKLNSGAAAPMLEKWSQHMISLFIYQDLSPLHQERHTVSLSSGREGRQRRPEFHDGGSDARHWLSQLPETKLQKYTSWLL
jgi:hypothetical protein